MPSPLDPVAFDRYLAVTFPDTDIEANPIEFGRIQLRFELGDDLPNGSTERIAQATQRAETLFNVCNSPSDDLVLIIKIWDESGCEILPTEPPEYLFTLIREYDSKPRADFTIVPNPYNGGYRQMLLSAKARDLDVGRIFEAIANLYQGRTPRINESVYFVNATNHIVFHMYDDCGCLIWSHDPESLRGLYVQRQGWLVKAWQDLFVEVFGDFME